MGVALRTLNGLLRWGLWLLAVLLIVAALYVSVGRQFTPLMAEYREEIQQQLQERLQQNIRIEQLKGGWSGFSPLLEARYVTLGSGTDAMQVEELQIQPDVIASLLARELRLKAVTLVGLQIHLQENQEGQWALQGLQLDDADNAVFQLNDFLGRLQQVARLSVLNSRIIIQGYDKDPLVLNYAGFTLSRIGQQHRLDLRAVLPDGETLELSAQAQLLKHDWRKSTLTLYLKTPSSNLAQWLPNDALPGWQIDTLKIGGELWLDAQQGQMRRAVLRLAGLDVQGQAVAAEPLHLQASEALAFYQNNAGVQSAWFERLQLQIDDLPPRDWRILASYENATSPLWRFGVEQFELSDVHYLLERVVRLPEVAVDVLSTMQPSGVLDNLQLELRPDAPLDERLSFVSNVKDVGFSAWHDVPAATDINGHISGGLTQGELRLASDTGFSLHLAKLFAQPWQYQRAHAQLLWQFDKFGFTLRSPYLQVHGEEGDIAGDFLIRLLKDPTEEDYMDLRVGLRDGDARFTSKYLPSRVPEFSDELEHWLTTAIQAGHIDQGYFQYQGSLNKGTPPESRSISLYFAVKDAQLDYQPGWPALTEGVAEVLIEDSGVRISLEHGKILNSSITSAYAEVPLGAAGTVPVLQLHAELQSDVVDGLYFLQKTPIAEATQEFAKWQGKGDLPATLDLTVPLAKQPAVHIQLAMDAQRAELQMPDINVYLRELSGQFLFDSQRGLSAKKVTGQFLGQSFSGHIEAQGRSATHIDVQGLMPVARLTEWAEITQPIPVSGNLPYRLRVMLDGEDSQLRVDSSLLGVKVDLPAPFGKSASQQSYADWRMTLSGTERRYWFDYADQLSLNLAAPADNMLKGRARLRVGGGLADLPAQAGLQVRGRLNDLNLADWQQTLQRYSGPDQDSQKLLKSATLDIRRFNGFGLVVDNLNIDLRAQATGWQLALNSQKLKGQITEQGANKPTRVHFTQLHLPKTLSTVDGQDALADFDMRSIPALDIQVDALYQNSSSLGAWSLSTRPQAQGVLFDKLNLSLKGLNVTGQAGWQSSKGKVQSWYKGRLAGDNLSDVLLAWGFAPSITSKTFRADTDIRWAGSPAAFDMAKLNGDLDINFQKGQMVTIDGSAQALRVFGLLNFDSIGRRLRLDFSDLLGKGLAYDRVKGKLQIDNGIYRTNKTLNLEGPSSDLELEGQLDLVKERINAKLQVALPITNNLPLAAIAIGAPAIGGALFVVDRLIGDRLARFASVTYHISGDWQHPNISLTKKTSK